MDTNPNYMKNVHMFLHCGMCMDELPDDKTPADYAEYHAGLTEDGDIEIWCKRHQAIIIRYALKDPPEQFCCMCGDPNCGKD